MTTETAVWRSAAQAVLQGADTPMHYLDIKRMILERGLVGPGLQTPLESVLFKDAKSPDARFKLMNSQGMFLLMTDQERAAHQAKFSTSAPTGSDLVAPLHGHSSQTATHILQSGKVKVIKIKRGPGRGPGRPRLQDRAQNGLHLNRATNDKFRRKYLKLKKFAKKMLFVNAAVCDEVSRVEDKLTRARTERRYLVKKLLNHQTVSDALVQMASKQPNAAAMLGQSLGPGALSKLPVGIAGPLSLDMSQDSSPETKPKTKKKNVPGAKKRNKDTPSSDEKPKHKKKVSVKPSSPGHGGAVGGTGGMLDVGGMGVTVGEPGAVGVGGGSLRHLLTTKTVMEPP